MIENTIGIELLANDGKKKELKVPAKRLSSNEKMRSAFITWLAFMGLALISLFIPVAHFVLVPLFLGLSFYFAFSTYKNALKLGDYIFECPSCGKDLALANKKTKENFRVHCNSCRSQIRIKALQ